MEQQPHIHIGTSGWSYKHWAKIFYPPEVKSKDYLSYYSTQFQVSEINNSFYKIPKRDTVQKWVESVPEHFLFCPKMSRYLSHLKKLNDPEEPLRRFFDVFDPFKDHLGPILIQLPAVVRFKEELVTAFFELLKQKYSDYRFAIEVRHESWFSGESIQLMKDFGVTLAIAESEAFPYHEEVTAKDIFVRFHGPKELYSSSYSEAAIQGYAEKFVHWRSQGHNIWAFYNNDVNGHAFRNAAMLQRFVDAMT